jgi:hypothetical protein
MLSVHSRAEIVALSLVTALRLKEFELLPFFYALRDNSFLQGFAQAHHGAQECGVVSTGANVLDEGSIVMAPVSKSTFGW